MILLTEHLNGEDLYELAIRCQSHEEYWTIFHRFNKELEKIHQRTLPISVYLRFLRHTLKYSNIPSL